MNMSLNQTIHFKESQGARSGVSPQQCVHTVRFIFHHTVVNSFTFGEVTGTGGMRRVDRAGTLPLLKKAKYEADQKIFFHSRRSNLALCGWLRRSSRQQAEQPR